MNRDSYKGLEVQIPSATNESCEPRNKSSACAVLAELTWWHLDIQNVEPSTCSDFANMVIYHELYIYITLYKIHIIWTNQIQSDQCPCFPTDVWHLDHSSASCRVNPLDDRWGSIPLMVISLGNPPIWILSGFPSNSGDSFKPKPKDTLW